MCSQPQDCFTLHSLPVVAYKSAGLTEPVCWHMLNLKGVFPVMWQPCFWRWVFHNCWWHAKVKAFSTCPFSLLSCSPSCCVSKRKAGGEGGEGHVSTYLRCTWPPISSPFWVGGANNQPYSAAVALPSPPALVSPAFRRGEPQKRPAEQIDCAGWQGRVRGNEEKGEFLLLVAAHLIMITFFSPGNLPFPLTLPLLPSRAPLTVC